MRLILTGICLVFVLSCENCFCEENENLDSTSNEEYFESLDDSSDCPCKKKRKQRLNQLILKKQR